MSQEPACTDVVIVGAGMAGATAAFVLARAGCRVELVDPTDVQPPVFKAEKITAANARLLRAFGLMEHILPECRRVKQIACGQNGRVWTILQTEEYGFYYQDVVNAVRSSLPPTVRRHLGRVESMRTSPEEQEISLADGKVLRGRLLVLAGGATGRLHEKLGLQRRMFSAQNSVSLAFNLEPTDRLPNGAESVTYREQPFATGIDYLTLFPVKDVLRANMFTYWDVKDARIQQLRQQGLAALLRHMPQLYRVTGPLTMTSTVEAKPIDLYRMEHLVQPGLVALGDMYQGVCPVTGSGMGKVLTDVEVLRGLVPEWLRTPGMGADKIGAYYADPRKRKNDDKSLADGLYGRRLGTDRSLAWHARRWKKYLPRWWQSVRHRQNDRAGTR